MLEYIVRPFQQPNAHGTIIIPATPTESTETAVITWGGEATLPAVQFIELGFNTKKGREDFVEQTRDSEVVRITGNDPDNWIDVQRSKKLYLDKTTQLAVNASSPGQSGYVAVKDLEDIIATSKDPEKTKATIELSYNTTPSG